MHTYTVTIKNATERQESKSLDCLIDKVIAEHDFYEGEKVIIKTPGGNIEVITKREGAGHWNYPGFTFDMVVN